MNSEKPNISCTCGYIKVGGTITESRNWHPECAEHGLKSDWYRLPAQVFKREADNARLRDLQRRAREARNAVR